MSYAVGEEEKLVAHIEMINVEGYLLHKVTIYEGYMSSEMQKSHNDEDVLFKSVDWMTLPCVRMEKL